MFWLSVWAVVSRIDEHQVRACCAAEFRLGLGPVWVIRGDIAMSALSSAIHNTGHYHVRPRPVCLPPSCALSANNGHSRRSPCVLASVDLANMTHVRPPMTRHIDCNKLASDPRPGCWPGFLFDRSLAKDLAGKSWILAPRMLKHRVVRNHSSWVGRNTGHAEPRSPLLDRAKRRVLAFPVLHRSGGSR
jgi:hypothetical protein